jgi:hypothetical protein
LKRFLANKSSPFIFVYSIADHTFFSGTSVTEEFCKINGKPRYDRRAFLWNVAGFAWRDSTLAFFARARYQGVVSFSKKCHRK